MKNLKKSYPLVSVVIPTYNSRRTIENCLKSIKKQSYPNIEIIVVDSYNYDSKEREKCKKIIQKYAKYFLDGPERSIQRNRGIKEARGEYILAIDQDMYLTPNVIKECYNSLKSNEYVAVTIPEISFGEGFWTQCVALERYVSVYLEQGMNECCRFFKKSDLLKIGGYDTTIVGAEDSDLHYKMLNQGKITKIKSHIDNDEGRIRFFDRVKKKYYYSGAFKKYFKRYPQITVGQFFPIKIAYFKHWKVLAKHPLITGGIVLIRGAEVIAGATGLVFKKGD